MITVNTSGPVALVVQHLDLEGPGLIADALEAAGVRVQVHRSDLDPSAPLTAEGLDAVVVMGGPMSARSDDGFPSRSAELELLADAIAKGVPTLGVCLGAQLLAAAAGGSCVPGHGPEVGWAPVALRASAGGDTLFAGLPSQLTVLHWHGETVELPEGAEILASSTGYANQAFRIGERAWGLQFHLEVTAEQVGRFVEAFPQDASCAPGGPTAITGTTPRAMEALIPHATTVLGRFADMVAGRARAQSSASPQVG